MEEICHYCFSEQNENTGIAVIHDTFTLTVTVSLSCPSLQKLFFTVCKLPSEDVVIGSKVLDAFTPTKLSTFCKSTMFWNSQWLSVHHTAYIYIHPELSGCISTLIVRNSWRLHTLVQQWTP